MPRRYGPEVQERAYELLMIQGMPCAEVVRTIRQTCPKFSHTQLYRWKNDMRLDWEGRAERHRRQIAEAHDAERLKQLTPIMTTIQTIREETYKRLLEILQLRDENGKPVNPIDSKNIGQVMKAYVQLVNLEMQMTGGGTERRASIEQVIGVIFMAIERTPNVGPVFAAHRQEITDAVFEIIDDKGGE
jgi:hypothetical protein